MFYFYFYHGCSSSPFQQTEEEGCSHTNEQQSIPQRLSVCADDGILFLRATTDDANMAKYLLRLLVGLLA
jgi:hypothetical protein